MIEGKVQLMDRAKKRIISKALRKHSRILPCWNYQRLEECFTQIGKQLLFWYNTEDRSTHVIKGKAAGGGAGACKRMSSDDGMDNSRHDVEDRE